jgi:hypothetical protein
MPGGIAIPATGGTPAARGKSVTATDRELAETGGKGAGAAVAVPRNLVSALLMPVPATAVAETRNLPTASPKSCGQRKDPDRVAKPSSPAIRRTTNPIRILHRSFGLAAGAMLATEASSASSSMLPVSGISGTAGDQDSICGGGGGSRAGGNGAAGAGATGAAQDAGGTGVALRVPRRSDVPHASQYSRRARLNVPHIEHGSLSEDRTAGGNGGGFAMAVPGDDSRGRASRLHSACLLRVRIGAQFVGVSFEARPVRVISPLTGAAPKAHAVVLRWASDPVLRCAWTHRARHV